MSIEPVKKEILVEAGQERAFDVFTAGMDRWWPRAHHMGPSPLKRIQVEPRLGGRWYSLCEDGSEIDVGKVLAWDRPRRVVLAWQLTAEWRYDAAFVTEVEVTFTVEGAKRTRVSIEHRDLERFAAKADDMRKALDGPDGWRLTLDLFAQSAASAN